jgi:hypothetical protein
VDRAAGVASAIGSYLEARRELLALEAKDVGGRLAVRSVGVAVIGLLLVFAYALLMAGLIGLLSGALGWEVIALILAALHLVVAGVIGFLIRRPLPPLFPLTREELKKDTTWLQSLKSPAKKP